MASHSAAKSHPSTPAILKLTDGDLSTRQIKEVSARLRRRAYELFEGRGRRHGSDLEDWFQAEAELLDPLFVEITPSDRHLIVRADVPGFRDKDLEVRVERRRVTICGKRELFDGRAGRRALRAERTSHDILRCLDLSEEVDPGGATAMLVNGTLEVRLPRVQSGRKTPLGMHAA